MTLLWGFNWLIVNDTVICSGKATKLKILRKRITIGLMPVWWNEEVVEIACKLVCVRLACCKFHHVLSCTDNCSTACSPCQVFTILLNNVVHAVHKFCYSVQNHQLNTTQALKKNTKYLLFYSENVFWYFVHRSFSSSSHFFHFSLTSALVMKITRCDMFLTVLSWLPISGALSA